MNQVSCCCFDLECSSLNADFGVLLCGVVKGDGKKAVVFRADQLNPDWKTRRSDDRWVLSPLADELSRYDIWVAYNGTRFDVPFLRSRLAHWGLPPLTSHKLLDPCQVIRTKMKLSYNSLASAANLLGAPAKYPVSGRLWVRATLDGDSKAMDHIARHCVRDVQLLEKVCRAVKPYSTSFNAWGSAL
jgi:uncharacterized protein YprB with RNaseH-like and TPR domain